LKRSILFIVGLFLVLPMVGQYYWGYDGQSWLNTHYPTSESKKFLVTFMTNYAKQVGETDLTLCLFATSREETHITVRGIWTDNETKYSYNYRRYYTIRPNSIDTFHIPSEVAYEQTSNQTSEAEWLNKGIIVEADHPISLYSYNATVGSMDASLILPVEGLYKEHMIQTFEGDAQSTEFAIISAANYNAITVHLRETTGKTTKTSEISLYLNEGQSYCYTPTNGKVSLTGTWICSSEPIAVFQGGRHAQIPLNQSNNSHIYHQAFPTDYWGKEYVVTRTAQQAMDVILITATEDDTKIYENGTLVKTLNKFETFTKNISWSNGETARYYTSSNASECYIYSTGYRSSHGAPALSQIVPQELGINDIIFATYRETRVDELFLPEDAQDTLDHYYQHYVNIVAETSTISGITLDGNDISSSFKPLADTKYSCANIRVSNKSHVVKSAKGTFTARVYGIYAYEGEDFSYDVALSYAYSGGSRTTHSADMLMQDKYIDSVELCGNDPLDLKALIRYDYTNVRWQLIDSMNWGVISNPRKVGNDPKHVVVDSFPPIYEGEYVDWTVNLFVTRSTPLCSHSIRDTITANARVYRTHFNDSVFAEGKSAKEICYGNNFTVEYVERGATQSTKHTFKADSTIEQNVNHGPYGKVRFKLDSLYFFNDSLHTSYLGCDSIIQQRIVIRPTYKDIQYDTICVNQFPYRWRLNGDFDYMETKVDTTQAWKNQYILTNPNSPYKVGVIDTFVNLKTVCNCDSIIHLNLTVLPIYRLSVNYGEECGSSDTLMWPGHLGSDGMPLPGHKIYCNGTLMDHPITKDVEVRTTFKLVDSLKINRCTSCYGNQICDSIWTLTQTVKKVTNINQNVCICDVESFVWLDTLWLGRKCDYPTSTAYKAVRRIQRADTTLSVRYKTQGDGCDSVYKATVHFNPSYMDYPVDTTVFHICEQDTFVFRHDPYQTVHQWEVEDGHVDRYEFRDTVPTAVKCGHGCDSIVLHYVYVHPSYTLASKTDTVCLNTEYLWAGHTPTEGTDRYYWIDELNQRVRFDSVPPDRFIKNHHVSDLS